MIRSFLTVSSGTLASRLLGFLRDSMIAALLGTGAVADAFLVAFQLVNVARRLLSEGALNAALARYQRLKIWKTSPVIEPAAMEKFQDILVHGHVLEQSKRVKFQDLVLTDFAAKAK